MILDFYNNLEENDFSERTIKKRLCLFMDACNIKLENNANDNSNNGNTISYNDYYKEIERDISKKAEYIRYISVNGEYGDLKFTFKSKYNLSILKNKIKKTPYIIELDKSFNDSVYRFKIEDVKFFDGNNNRVIFNIYKINKNDKEKVVHHCFYGNIYNFDRILSIVRAFVNNPEIVFDICNSITIRDMTSKFSNKQIKKIELDSKNDSRLKSKIKKKVKSL